MHPSYYHQSPSTIAYADPNIVYVQHQDPSRPVVKNYYEQQPIVPQYQPQQQYQQYQQISQHPHHHQPAHIPSLPLSSLTSSTHHHPSSDLGVTRVEQSEQIQPVRVGGGGIELRKTTRTTTTSAPAGQFIGTQLNKVSPTTRARSILLSEQRATRERLRMKAMDKRLRDAGTRAELVQRTRVFAERRPTKAAQKLIKSSTTKKLLTTSAAASKEIAKQQRERERQRERRDVSILTIDDLNNYTQPYQSPMIVRNNNGVNILRSSASVPVMYANGAQAYELQGTPQPLHIARPAGLASGQTENFSNILAGSYQQQVIQPQQQQQQYVQRVQAWNQQPQVQVVQQQPPPPQQQTVIYQEYQQPLPQYQPQYQQYQPQPQYQQPTVEYVTIPAPAPVVQYIQQQPLAQSQQHVIRSSASSIGYGRGRHRSSTSDPSLMRVAGAPKQKHEPLQLYYTDLDPTLQVQQQQYIVPSTTIARTNGDYGRLDYNDPNLSRPVAGAPKAVHEPLKLYYDSARGEKEIVQQQQQVKDMTRSNGDYGRPDAVIQDRNLSRPIAGLPKAVHEPLRLYYTEDERPIVVDHGNKNSTAIALRTNGDYGRLDYSDPNLKKPVAGAPKVVHEPLKLYYESARGKGEQPLEVVRQQVMRGANGDYGRVDIVDPNLSRPVAGAPKVKHEPLKLYYDSARGSREPVLVTQNLTRTNGDYGRFDLIDPNLSKPVAGRPKAVHEPLRLYYEEEEEKKVVRGEPRYVQQQQQQVVVRNGQGPVQIVRQQSQPRIEYRVDAATSPSPPAFVSAAEVAAQTVVYQQPQSSVVYQQPQQQPYYVQQPQVAYTQPQQQQYYSQQQPQQQQAYMQQQYPHQPVYQQQVPVQVVQQQQHRTPNLAIASIGYGKRAQRAY